MKNRYDTIVFDLGNTLIRFDHNIAIGKLRRNYDIDEKAAYGLFFDSEMTHLFETGAITPHDFYVKATLALKIDIPYGDFMDIWNDIFWEDEESCALARQLKKRYKLFLLSNVNKSHFEHIRNKFDIIRIFDELILSYLVGAMKPDKRIFDDVITRAGGDKSKLIYIDDREDLIKEAYLLGIDAIRFEGAGNLVKALEKNGIL